MRQAEIHRAGVFGRRPRVSPISPSSRDFARKAMSPEAFAYVAGAAGTGSTIIRLSPSRPFYDAARVFHVDGCLKIF
jgi:hypothetical protein